MDDGLLPSDPTSASWNRPDEAPSIILLTVTSADAGRVASLVGHVARFHGDAAPYAKLDGVQSDYSLCSLSAVTLPLIEPPSHSK